MKNIILSCIIITCWGISAQPQTLNYDPDPWMPDTIPLALGNTIELYNNNIAFIRLNDTLVDFSWEYQVGASDSLKWGWAANQAGNFKLTFNCFFKDSLIKTIHTIIRVVDKVKIARKNLLTIGNSLTQSGYGYQFAQISSDLNFEVNPIGTRGSATKNEGHSGWLFESFIHSGSPFYIDNRINFKKYIENNNLPNPDIVRISLGINECLLSSSHTTDRIMNNAIHLADTIYRVIIQSLGLSRNPPTCYNYTT